MRPFLLIGANMSKTMREAVEQFDRPDDNKEPFIIIGPLNGDQWAVYYQGSDLDLVEMMNEAKISVPLIPHGRA